MVKYKLIQRFVQMDLLMLVKTVMLKQQQLEIIFYMEMKWMKRNIKK